MSSTSRISVKGRAEALIRARHALDHIEQSTARRGQVGAARDQFNIAHNFNDPHAVWDAVYALECLVTDVCDLDASDRPAGCPTCQQ